MAKRIDTSAYTSFELISERLDQIVGEVRRKDLSLESSLDLFDEAIALGSKAVDFVDTEDPTPKEMLRAEEAQDAQAAAAENDVEQGDVPSDVAENPDSAQTGTDATPDQA